MEELTPSIMTIYVIMIVIWTIIILVFQLYENFKPLTLFILLLPYLIFIYQMGMANSFVKPSPNELFRDTAITIVIIFALPFLNYYNQCDRDAEHKKKSTKLTIFIVSLAFISLIPLQSDETGLSLWRYCRTSLEVMVIFLFIYIFAQYLCF